MKMDLLDFEIRNPPSLVERAREYYLNGAVQSIREVKKGTFLCSVEGTSTYTVKLVLSDSQEVLYSTCDCPYVNGSACKHVLAVLYALRSREGQGSSLSSQGSTVKKGLDPIDRLLRNHKELTLQVETLKAQGTPIELVTFLLEQIKELLEPAGSLASNTAGYLLDHCYTLLARECKVLVRQKEHSYELLCLLQAHGESCRYHSATGYLQRYLELLLELIEQEEQLRAPIDGLLCSLYEHLCHHEDGGSLTAAYMVLKSLYLLWYQHDVQRARALLVEQAGAKSLFRLALSIEDDHQKLLELTGFLLKERRFSKDVEKLILETRYTAAVLTCEKELQRESALALLYLGEYYCYQILKGLCTNSEFDMLVETILERVKESEVGYLYPKILADRKMYRELIDHIRKNLHLLHRYSELLVPCFPQEIYDLYELQIRQRASRIKRRTDLANLKWVLKLLRRHGGTSEAEALEEELKKQYPHWWPLA